MTNERHLAQGGGALAVQEIETNPLPDQVDVFVTVGTDHHQFDRLVSAIDEWSHQRALDGHPLSVFFQIGTSSPPGDGSWVRYLSSGDMSDLARRATVIVCHGGPATINEARSIGKRPIVLARRHHLDEHVDDHQHRFVSMMSERDEVLAADDISELLAHLERALDEPELLEKAKDPSQVGETLTNFGTLVGDVVRTGYRPYRPRLPRWFRRTEGIEDVLVVCSGGGHLAQLNELRAWIGDRPVTWVTFDMPDAHSLLDGERVIYAFHPTTRNIPNLARNLRLAWRLLRQSRPDLIVSNGAGVAVPFFWLSRLFGSTTAFVEVYDRVDLRTMTGRLCAPVSDLFLLQWPEQRNLYKRGVIIGPLL